MSQEVYSFSEFRLNEGIFNFWKKNKFGKRGPIANIFKKEDDDLAERILNYLKSNFNKNDLEYKENYRFSFSKIQDEGDEFIYKYLIRPRPKNQDIDPLGEEDWGEGRDADTIITLRQLRGGGYLDRDKEKKIFINDAPLVISEDLYDDIWKILDAPRAESERIEKERIKRLADEAAEVKRIKDIEEQRKKEIKDAKDKEFKDQLRKKTGF